MLRPVLWTLMPTMLRTLLRAGLGRLISKSRPLKLHIDPPNQTLAISNFYQSFFKVILLQR
jgi:hypothetical protein